jgi:nucleoside phosphorylase
MLSILIIEDTPEKLASIRDVVNSITETNIDYSVVQDIKQALDKLSNNYYDLLIVDIFIPFEWGEDPNPQNAINLLQQLPQDEDLISPFSILAITKKEELASEFKNKLEELTVTLLQYRENSDSWKPQLQNRLKTMVQAKKSFFNKQEYEYDVAIINALQEPEHMLLKSVFGCDWKSISYPLDDFNNYYEGSLVNKNGKRIRCVATYANQMASIASSALTTKVIYNFRPKHLFMTGIAAGVSPYTMNYGDILIASEVFDGASGKIKADKDTGETVFEPDIRQKTVTPEFINIITRLKSDKTLLNSICDNYPTNVGKPTTQLAIHIGPMASVPAVLSCKQEIDKITTHGRKLQGIEMESYGMFYAASSAIKPLPKIVASIKSVSDFADIKKSDDYQEYASYTSAALLKHILLNELDY